MFWVAGSPFLQKINNEDYEDYGSTEELKKFLPLLPMFQGSLVGPPALGTFVLPFMKIFGNLFKGLPFVLSPYLIAFKAALQNLVLNLNPVMPYVLQLLLFPILAILPKTLSAHLAVAVPLILFVILPPLLGPLSNVLRVIIRFGTRVLRPYLPVIQALGRHRLSLVTLVVSLVVSLVLRSKNASIS